LHSEYFYAHIAITKFRSNFLSRSRIGYQRCTCKYRRHSQGSPFPLRSDLVRPWHKHVNQRNIRDQSYRDCTTSKNCFPCNNTFYKD
jgi:hypothetical protein